MKDTGFGISREDLDRIFERFYRVKDDKTRMISGTGLGLAIVKSIVEAHNGRIEAESEVDRGSTFHVFLPIMHRLEFVKSRLPPTYLSMSSLSGKPSTPSLASPSRKAARSLNEGFAVFQV